MKGNSKRKGKPQIIAIWIVVVIVLITSIGIAVKKLIFDKNGDESDSYEITMKAIEKTESKEDFFVQISSSSRIYDKKISQQVSTNGYIYTTDKKDFVYIYANTKSNTLGSAANDFDVTVAMYSDGKNVYDNSTGKDELVEGITCEEFNNIVSEYELYKFNKEDVIKFTFNEDKNYKDGKSGDMLISFTRPNENVMNSLKEAISQYTKEDVSVEKINVVSAIAIYSIYEGTVISQSCSFNVNYEQENGNVIKYSTETNITYFDEENTESTSFISTKSEA